MKPFLSWAKGLFSGGKLLDFGGGTKKQGSQILDHFVEFKIFKSILLFLSVFWKVISNSHIHAPNKPELDVLAADTLMNNMEVEVFFNKELLLCSSQAWVMLQLFHTFLKVPFV